MENSKFKTVVKCDGHTRLSVGDVIFDVRLYGTVRHANSTKRQETYVGNNGIETVPSTNVELLKLWDHATIKRKYGVHASKELLREELENRGYTLRENGHRWDKPVLVTV